MEYLLDTDWVAEYLRGRATVVRAIDGRRGAGLAVSVVTVVTLAEVFSGIARARHADTAEASLGQFLGDVRVIGIDERICRIWGREDARLSAAGTHIGDLDLFIAATALGHGLTLCTQNRKHSAPSLPISRHLARG